MRTAIALTILLTTATAHADEVAGVVIDDAKVGIPAAAVRIVGDAVVISTRADRSGQFRANGLPHGHYRIEVDRGTVREPYPPSPIRITQERIRCCFCRSSSIQLLPPLQRGHIDTRSTALGIVLSSPGR